MKIITVCLLFTVSSVLCAAFAEFSGKPAKRFSVSGQKIEIFPKARVVVGTQSKARAKPRELHLTGAGVREKKILVVSANVYVLAHYTDGDAKAFVKNPQAAIQEGNTEMLQLTLLRDLSAAQIKDSFKDALEENGVSIESQPIQTIFSQLLKDQKAGDVITIVSEKGEKGLEILHFDACGKVFSVTGPHLGSDFWKIWFGKPADGGLEDLQKELLKSS